MKPPLALIVVAMIPFLIMLLMNETTLAKQNNTNIAGLIYSNTSDSFKSTASNSINYNDSNPPTVTISYPSYPPTLATGNITLKGTANDSSGIKAISAEAKAFPLNESKRIRPVLPPSLVSHGNLSNWSIPFTFKQPGVYRILVTARDNANNTGHAQTTVNIVPIQDPSLKNQVNIQPKIAFVRSTFTEAAYQKHGFYDFYYKYGFPPYGKNITTDLDMLTVKTIPSTPEIVREDGISKLSNLTAIIPNDNGLRSFYIAFINQTKKVAPNATVTVMRDEDVHDSNIFYVGNNKTNAYDVLLLFHNEYVTQQEYDNLRQFVKNGGTIVFIDPNIFYGEIRYDKDNHTSTLVKGHSWDYDGKAARRSVSERWYNETKEWVGANYLLNYLSSNTTFANNPFNYTHFEEQFVNNPKDKIIIDYGVRFPKDFEKVQSAKNELPIDKRLEDVIIATYTLNYGTGKVIMLGLYGQNLAKSQEFMRFFDNMILPTALCPKFQSCYLS